MRIPSDQIHGSPSFHSSVRKQADGSFLAINTSMPDVAPVSAWSESEAIRALTQATEKWIGDGCPAAGKK